MNDKNDIKQKSTELDENSKEKLSITSSETPGDEREPCVQ
jgi:hypothetical protein